ncbi:MAG: co-chaperone DjlA [Woeseiaceae bacterium]|nr:co-chaperone DjlA [Woeseiaceae bacterium]
MPYWGKVVGAVAGLATGRPLLALVGLILGHQFDRGFAAKQSRAGGTTGDGRRLPGWFLEPLFQSMGHLAKADGRVSEDEIRAARALMHRLGLGPAEARRAIDWFQAGKAASFPLANAVATVRRNSGRNEEWRRLFLRLLLEVALAKGSLHQRERRLLWTISSSLGVGRVELTQLEAMLRAQRSFRRSPQGDADAERLDKAYRTLGVSRSATNDEIKKAYRRLINRAHPDKLSGPDVGQDAIKAAGERTRDIRSAYEMLKVRRSIR